MGALLSCAACNLAQCAACACCSCITNACCSCCGSSSQKSSGKKAKAVYLFLYLLTIVVAIIMRYYGADSIDLKFWKINCQPPNLTPAPSPSSSIFNIPDLTPAQQNYYFQCSGNAAVYRLSFGTTAFFVLVMLATLCSNEAHSNWWCVKIPLYLLCNIGAFFLPSDGFDDSGYAWASRVISVFFLLLQILILIEFGYSWNAVWLAKSQEARDKAIADGEENAAICCAGFTWYEWGILLTCAGCYASWFIAIVCLYIYVKCPLAQFFVSITLLAVIGFTAVQLFCTEDGALLPSAMVAGYCAYLVWSAIASDPSSCNTITDSGSDNGGLIFVGIVFTALSLVWTSYSTAESVGSIMPPKQGAEDFMYPNQPTTTTSTEMVPVSRTTKEGDVDESPAVTTQPAAPPTPTGMYEPNKGLGGDAGSDPDAARQQALDDADTESYWVFHTVMVLGSLYIAMLLTDWGSAPDDPETGVGGTRATPSAGRTAMWVKIISQWVTIAIYLWTLISARVGPMCCPDREFG